MAKEPREMAPGTAQLLEADEPPPVTIEHADGASVFVIACDHAGNRLPRRLGTLGLSERERQRHIAWDIGAGAVAQRLAAALDAFFIRQTYSRLAIDCNRPPEVPSSIATLSELTPIPGNCDLTPEERAARIREIFAPYHERLATELDRRQVAALPTVLVALHSFTPVFKEVARPWHIGLLYGRDARFARCLMPLICAEGDFLVGDNEPYAVSDASDYTVPVHGERRGLPHIEIELRQDLVADADGQNEWAARLARWLPQAYRQFSRP